MFIQPLFTPLGFGSQLTSIGWVFAVAAITGLIAKENVIATFITLGAVAVAFLNSGTVDPAIIDAIKADEEGVTAVTQMINATGITWQGCISFIAFNMLTIPCFAACATARAELKKGTFKFTLLFWIITSFIGACFVYVFLSCFDINSLAWALPVTLGLVIIGVCTFVSIRVYNKRKAEARA
jgi:ferrous iron transport protein B